jgi:hypothetical protein
LSTPYSTGEPTQGRQIMILGRRHLLFALLLGVVLLPVATVVAHALLFQ